MDIEWRHIKYVLNYFPCSICVFSFSIFIFYLFQFFDSFLLLLFICFNIPAGSRPNLLNSERNVNINILFYSSRKRKWTRQRWDSPISSCHSMPLTQLKPCHTVTGKRVRRDNSQSKISTKTEQEWALRPPPSFPSARLRLFLFSFYHVTGHNRIARHGPTALRSAFCARADDAIDFSQKHPISVGY